MGLCVVSFMLGVVCGQGDKDGQESRDVDVGLAHGFTYTGSVMTSTQTTKTIRCAHQNRLKCAPTRAPKDCLTGATTPTVSASSTTWPFVTDILSTLGMCVSRKKSQLSTRC